MLAENQEFSAVIIILPFAISSSVFLQWKKALVSLAKIQNLPRGQQFGRNKVREVWFVFLKLLMNYPLLKKKKINEYF